MCEFPDNIPKDVALCLFRVTQKALGNVVKHSHARCAHVELDGNGNSISLRITDEGQGFDPAGTSEAVGIGLVGMSERLRLIGGSLLIQSNLMRVTDNLADELLCHPVNSTHRQPPLS